MDKKQIEVQLPHKEWEGIEEFDGSLDEVLARLKQLNELGYINIRFEPEYSYESSNVVCFGTRLETDEEFNARVAEIKEQEKKEALKKEKRKAQYEKLKKEFGNG